MFSTSVLLMAVCAISTVAVAHERRLNERKFGSVVSGWSIGQVPTRKELSGGEKPAVNGVVVPMRFDETLNREAALKIFVPGRGRSEVGKCGFARVLDDL